MRKTNFFAIVFQKNFLEFCIRKKRPIAFSTLNFSPIILTLSSKVDLDMQKNHSELWEECLSFIKDNIGAEQYDVWFSPISCLSFENNELRLILPSSFFAEYIEQKYLGVLGAAIRKVFGSDVQLYYHYYLENDEPKSVVEVKSTPTSRVVAPSPDKQIASPFTATRAADIDPQLNPRYTFENYCSSESNKIAVTIAESIAKNPNNNPFNPLFVFGPTGVGKTHLIQAIGIRIKEQNPENRVLYVTARLFMSQYTTAILKGENNKFFNFYQSIHTLIIDDVQDLSGKQSTQNTLYHIFNHLYLNNRQIIFSSDRAPAEMDGFEERLLGRFKCGMSVSLEKPDKDLRRNVLKLKARQDGIELDDEIIEYIAGNVTDSIRELEGIMVSLVAHATILNKPITLDLAKIVVCNAIKINRRQINFEVIAREVSTFFGLEPDVLFTKSRKREISDARQITMYLAKKLTSMPLTAIGRQIARSHATVIYSINNIEERLDIERQLKADIEKIEAAITGA